MKYHSDVDIEDEKIEYPDWLIKCPECNGVSVSRIRKNDNNDLYVSEYECFECGATWEE